MRFAGENELHRPGGIVQQFVQAIFVAEKKRAAFVGRETSRKTDGENFRIENAIGRANGFRRFADALALRLAPVRARTRPGAVSISGACPKDAHREYR